MTLIISHWNTSYYVAWLCEGVGDGTALTMSWSFGSFNERVSLSTSHIWLWYWWFGEGDEECTVAIKKWFSTELQHDPNTTLKSFDPLPPSMYIEYMSNILQRKRIELEYFHRDTNKSRVHLECRRGLSGSTSFRVDGVWVLQVLWRMYGFRRRASIVRRCYEFCKLQYTIECYILSYMWHQNTLKVKVIDYWKLHAHCHLHASVSDVRHTSR